MRPIAEAAELPEGTLLVDQAGAYLGKRSERLRLTVKGEQIEERSLLGLEHVLVLGNGVSLSADAIRVCAERGIPISFISRSGVPYAKLVAPELTGTVQTRRHQLLAFGDQRGVTLAKAFAHGKLLNQAALLKYMAKYRQRVDLAIHEMARDAAYRLEYLATRLDQVEGDSIDDVRLTIMNLEAQGAHHYWAACRELVHLEEGVTWVSRETRGATDLVNQCLNYGYGILYAQVERAVLLAGLDPYAGFLHEDRPGKPSLVLDLVEEFRPYAVDRAVYTLLNQRVALHQDNTGRLDAATRTTLAQRVNDRLEAEEFHEGRRRRLRTIIQSQARRVATTVRGEAVYHPWLGRWCTTFEFLEGLSSKSNRMWYDEVGAPTQVPRFPTTPQLPAAADRRRSGNRGLPRRFKQREVEDTERLPVGPRQKSWEGSCTPTIDPLSPTLTIMGYGKQLPYCEACDVPCHQAHSASSVNAHMDFAQEPTSSIGGLQS
jgi:CRISPR-associated protein Cas1